MSLASNKLLKTIQINEKGENKNSRMGIITGTTGVSGQLKIRFCGEEEVSNLYYTTFTDISRLAIGDRVLLEKKCGKYYITKKVN